METTPPVVSVRFNKFLPYWAVLQTDIGQTLRGWLYRLWVLTGLAAAAGFLIYRVGVHQEAGLVRSAAVQCADLLRLLFLGSLAWVVVLSVSAVGAERGSLADAVLSRGISRYQYYLAKWHSRLVVVLATFAVLVAGVLVAGYFLFRTDAETDLTLSGGAAVVLTLGAALAVVVSWGVFVGAVAHSTVLGITVLWLLLYGAGLVLTLVPESWPSPERELARLRYVLQGHYSDSAVANGLGLAMILSGLAAVVGVIGFGRRDV